jgi:fructose-1,6-bisphosphatase II / sedoheptulose-1,7-bisphosphatase
MQQQGMFSPMVMASKVLDRVLVIEMVRVTEAAAISASNLVGPRG